MNLELLQTITILYVEDEATLQDEIYQNIKPFVKNIIKASNGYDGIKKFKENQSIIDLIVSDILMPQMNGIDMVDTIREIDLEIPIIYTTAFSDNEYMKKTIEQGIVSYILKPIDVELLVNAISKASIIVENNHLKSNLKTINLELENRIAIKTKELEKQNILLNTQLHVDELTQLKNRKALSRDIQDNNFPIITLVDIDSFKHINDLYGEDVGDAVLINMANLLQKISEDYKFDLYRVGVDEFVLLKNSVLNRDICDEIVQSIIKNVNEHVIYILESEITLRIDVTIGISQGRNNTLQRAGMALKKAKQNRISYKFYDDSCSLEKEYENDTKWTKEIEKAIKSNNVVAYYQPIVDENSNIIKYEALMRIKDNDKVYSPFLFLDIAKKVKFYPQLASIMINTVFNKVFQEKKNININLSIEDIESSKIIELIKYKLNENKIGHFITFEIVESEDINDYEKVIKFIQMVKEFDCKIAIDDFGSGYSNFSYLLKLEPDYIKIDGSLIKNIDVDEDSYIITKMINDIAHSMGMKTVAEFVHSKEVYDVLLKLNIDEYQGYYFGEPKEII